MSYAAEPYAQFVEDLLGALTGGVIRETFRFRPRDEPFRLGASGAVLPDSVRVFGQVEGVFHRFRPRTDYRLRPGSTLEWLARSDGTPAAEARWPDPGSTFYVNYALSRPGSALPPLTDRNPGSVTRLLAESFAREFAVLSRQLETVYRAGFLDTAGGRDLEQLVALVGLSRRRRSAAVGSVVFGRATPAPADIFIPAGTRLSTVEPPPVAFETVEDVTLRRGELSAEAPVQALLAGSVGVVPARALAAVHRPILGVDTVANPEATRFGGAAESDEALRARARRALETAGGATTGALMGALASLPGVREKDVRIDEDPLAHPGVVKLSLALPALPEEERRRLAARAVALIEDTRPVGVRVLHNIDAAPPAGPASPGTGVVDDAAEAPAALGPAPADDLFLPVDVVARIVPVSSGLGAQDREGLLERARGAIAGFIEEAGIGEILIYNRLVARLMAVEGLLDVALEMYPQADPGQPHHRNLVPENPAVRPVPGLIDVDLGGALVMLDVTVAVTLRGAGLLGDPATARAAARGEVEDQLRQGLTAPEVAGLTPAVLLGMVPGSESYAVDELHYTVEYLEAGVRIHRRDVALPLTGLERFWVRRVSLSDGSGS